MIKRQTRKALMAAGCIVAVPRMTLTANAQERAADQTGLAFSDPANVRPAPPWAVGQANRSPDLDALPGFAKPPAGFGLVPFYWWLGDPLTQERLSWQLDQLTDMGISGLQINYAHTNKGGLSWGLTIPSDPKLFTQDWWNLVGWFMKQAKSRGIAVSLSDYTLGVGQGWVMDDILRDHPELTSTQLRLVKGDAPADALMKTTVTGTDGTVQQMGVRAETVPFSYDPMNPLSGPEYARRFFGQFEDRNPGEGGKGLNFFFSDELEFRLGQFPWTSRFTEEFKKRKGYDIVPELPALFMDMGPRTPKVRLDYADVRVALTEEGFFKPVFDWHQQRGMTMGCDHGGRGHDVVEFGDYFRTQRWNQGPGCDQPNLGRDLIKTKVASSIAHLYQRPRVWLEGYYGSGWGTSSAGVVDATFANFVMGHNLLSLHGLYYSTHGGWWEWAPPCNGFHMPYWKQMRGFTACVERLSYVLSQGDHRCDVAILYPVASMEAGMDGPTAVKAAFDTGRQVYAEEIDFDFMDFESLARAKVVGKELHVSGEVYRVLVLPAMKAVRHSTLQKALEFHRAGGVVVAVGALPEASDRVGRDDPEVAAMVKELFPDGPVSDVAACVPSRDFQVLGQAADHSGGYVMHRKLGQRDLYAVYNLAQGTACRFRATGKAELWDPWTGQTRPLTITSQRDGVTELALPLTAKEIQLIVFDAGTPELVAASSPVESAKRTVEGTWEFEIAPMLDNRFGDFHWPPTPTLIGAEARQIQYTEGDPTKGPWHRVTNTFGPQFKHLGPVAKLADESTLTPDAKWKPYEFSWRWGVEGDPGRQGYHGLKGVVFDEFVIFPDTKPNASANYLWTTVQSESDQVVQPRISGLKPAAVWINGQPDAYQLKRGTNTVLLRYDLAGRGAFVLETAAAPQDWKQPLGLSMSWFEKPGVLPFDVQPEVKNPIGWYRFTSPPGLREMTINAHGKVQAWVNGKPAAVRGQTIVVDAPDASPVPVLLKIEQERGYYGGAALEEPIRLNCGKGRIALGDWSQIDGLLSYSGSAWYRKTLEIPAAKRIVLDLGEVVASAEVRVNGKTAGVRVCPPWRFDITQAANAGENQIEILVHNTLANHYTTVPTNYRGSTVSGLIGPVTLDVTAK